MWYRDTAVVVILDFVLLVALVLAVRRWQRSHGRIGAKRAAVLLCSYWTFFFISTLWPALEINLPGGPVVISLLIVVSWAAGYPWFRWLYERFTDRQGS